MPKLCPRLLVTDCGKPRPGQVVRLHGELKKITDTKSAPIKEYAEGYGSLTDEQADSLIRRWLDSDIAAFEFRRRYLPIFRQVLNGKITATFFQVEHRINAIIDLQLTSQMLWHVPKLYVHRKAEALPAYQRRRWLPCHSARQDYRSGAFYSTSKRRVDALAAIEAMLMVAPARFGGSFSSWLSVSGPTEQ